MQRPLAPAVIPLVALLAVACHADGPRTDDPPDGATGSEDGIELDGGSETADDETAGRGETTGSTEPPETCDGLDDDADGDVDEGCSCMPGDVQACFAGPPEAYLACRGTTQSCEGGAGSEAIWTWGACAGLCEGSTLALDDVAGTRILGAAAGDQFMMVGRAPLGDVDGDGELDLLAPSGAGDGSTPDVGVGYALYGGPCLQGSTIDLATLVLDGGHDDELRGGFVVDDATGSNSGFIVGGDVDGDGRTDTIVSDTGNSLAVVFGSPAPSASYAVSQPDGAAIARLVDGGGSHGMYGGIAAGDLDGDGFADVFMSANNNSTPTCPCAPNGVSVWWGRPTFAAETTRDALVGIGIGTVGMASQSNFSVLGGMADFDGDGHLDLVTGNGAANDGGVIPYRTVVWFGGPDRALPSDMLAVDGTNGFRIGGGQGRGVMPSHQHGDFDGDGIDDLVAFADVPYSHGAAVYIVHGRADGFPAELDAGALADGTTIPAAALLAPGATMGMGDIDGDGLDDLVVPLADPDAGGVAIVWGRTDADTVLDAENDPSTLVLAGAPGLGASPHVAVADVDGDGLGDVIVGAPMAAGTHGERSGAGFVKYGSCLAEHRDSTLVRGQDGDDVVDGAGGADVIHGGQGNDRIAVRDAAFGRVHGGLGEDTLALDVDGIALDLRSLGRARIQEIERFELGPGAQTLTLGLGDVSPLSSSSRVFVVEGDAADAVALAGAWMPAGDPDGDGLDAWVHGALEVRIRAGIDVSTPP